MDGWVDGTKDGGKNGKKDMRLMHVKYFTTVWRRCSRQCRFCTIRIYVPGSL